MKPKAHSFENVFTELHTNLWKITRQNLTLTTILSAISTSSNTYKWNQPIQKKFYHISIAATVLECYVFGFFRQYKTDPGHILGDAGRRQGPIAERDLSTLSCAVLRCLTHLCMFTGALFNPQQVIY